MLAEMRKSAEAKIEELRDRFEEIKKELHVHVPWDIGLPEIEVPEPVIDENLHGQPLVSSSWTWEEATTALKRHKSYGKQERSR